MRIEDKMGNYRIQGIRISVFVELIGMVILLIFYFITQYILLACIGVPLITAVVVLILYVKYLGRKNFILTSETIQFPLRPLGPMMGGYPARQLKIDEITGCRVYNNMILVTFGRFGYPIWKEELDDFDRARDALIELLKSRNVPVKIYHDDIVGPETFLT